MSRRRTVVLAGLLAVALPPSALAATHTLKGKFENGDGSAVMKVKTNKKGIPVKVTKLTINKAPTLCYDAEENRQTSGPPSGKAQLGSFKVKPFKTSEGVEYTAYKDAVKVKGVPYSVSISFDGKRAKSATGELYNSEPVDGKCMIADYDFAVKR